MIIYSNHKVRSKNIFVLSLICLIQGCNTKIESNHNAKIYTFSIRDNDIPTPTQQPNDIFLTSILKTPKNTTAPPTQKQKNEDSKYIHIAIPPNLERGAKSLFKYATHTNYDYDTPIKLAIQEFYKELKTACNNTIFTNVTSFLDQCRVEKEIRFICPACGHDILDTNGAKYSVILEDFTLNKNFYNYTVYCNKNCIDSSVPTSSFNKNNNRILTAPLFTLISYDLRLKNKNNSRTLDYIYQITLNTICDENLENALPGLKANTIIEKLPETEQILNSTLDALSSLKYNILLDLDEVSNSELLKILLFITFCNKDEIQEIQEAESIADLDLTRNKITSKSYKLVELGIPISKIHCLFATFLRWNTDELTIDRFLQKFQTIIKEQKYDTIYQLAKNYTTCDSKSLKIIEKIWEKAKPNVEKDILLLSCKEIKIMNALLESAEDEGIFSDSTFNKVPIHVLEFIVKKENEIKAKHLLKCESIECLSEKNLRIIAEVFNTEELTILTKKNNDIKEWDDENLLYTHTEIKKNIEKQKKSSTRKPIFEEKNKQKNNSIIKPDNNDKPHFAKNNLLVELPDYRISEHPESGEIYGESLIRKTKLKIAKKIPRTEKLTLINKLALSNSSEEERNSITEKAQNSVIRYPELSIDSNNESDSKNYLYSTPAKTKKNITINTTKNRNKNNILIEFIRDTKTSQKEKNEYTYQQNSFTFQEERGERGEREEEYSRTQYNNRDYRKTINPSEQSFSITEESPQVLVFYNDFFNKKDTQKTQKDHSPLSSYIYEKPHYEVPNQLPSTQSFYKKTTEYDKLFTKSEFISNTYLEKNLIKYELELLNLPYDLNKEKAIEILYAFPWLLNECLKKTDRMNQYFILSAINLKNLSGLETLLIPFLKPFDSKSIRDLLSHIRNV